MAELSSSIFQPCRGLPLYNSTTKRNINIISYCNITGATSSPSSISSRKFRGSNEGGRSNLLPRGGRYSGFNAGVTVAAEASAKERVPPSPPPPASGRTCCCPGDGAGNGVPGDVAVEFDEVDVSFDDRGGTPGVFGACCRWSAGGGIVKPDCSCRSGSSTNPPVPPLFAAGATEVAVVLWFAGGVFWDDGVTAVAAADDDGRGGAVVSVATAGPASAAASAKAKANRNTRGD